MGTLEADYLVVGTGALGMAFVDAMLDESAATFVMVDRHHMPGGHWNDAYPFVRLHQPSAFYGVSSRDLGSNCIDEIGSNKGYYDLATGAEVTAYFEAVMRERFLPSGRVQYLPMSNYDGAGKVSALLSSKTYDVDIRKRIVDASFFKTSVPSTHERPYQVDDDVVCITPNALPRQAANHRKFTIVGAGKTAMDAGIWLLDNGADPQAVRWICPRDSWLLNRAVTQPGATFFRDAVGGFADQVSAMRDASGVDDLFERLERAGFFLRIFPDHDPTMCHYATISEGEAAQLRRIANVIRGERVARLARGVMHMQSGAEIADDPDAVYIDCTASAVPFGARGNRPIFEPDRITLQMVNAPLATLSAAIIAYVEAHFENDEARNSICAPVKLADTPADWVRSFVANMMNQNAWNQHKELRRWIRGNRLDPFSAAIKEGALDDPANLEIMSRVRDTVPLAVMNLQKILSEAV